MPRRASVSTPSAPSQPPNERQSPSSPIKTKRSTTSLFSRPSASQRVPHINRSPTPQLPPIVPSPVGIEFPHSLSPPKPVPRSEHRASTLALARFLRVTGPNDSSPSPPTDTLPSAAMDSPEGLLAPASRTRKPSKFTSAAKSMGKESLSLFRRRHALPSPGGGISSDDVASGLRTSKMSNGDASVGPPIPPEELALMMNPPATYTLPAIFRTVDSDATQPSNTATNTVATPHDSIPIHKFRRPPPLLTRHSYDTASDEPSPAHISIDGDLGEFRRSPSPTTPTPSPEAHVQWVVRHRSRSNAGETYPTVPIRSALSPTHPGTNKSYPASPESSNLYFPLPSSVYPHSAASLGPSTTSVSVPVVTAPSPASMVDPPLSPLAYGSQPLSPPPNIPLPIPPSPIVPTSTRMPLTPSSLTRTPKGSTTLPNPTDILDLYSLQSQIDTLTRTVAKLNVTTIQQRAKFTEHMDHMSVLLGGFTERETWFKSRIEELEREKWNWEKEREGMRWLLRGPDGLATPSANLPTISHHSSPSPSHRSIPSTIASSTLLPSSSQAEPELGVLGIAFGWPEGPSPSGTHSSLSPADLRRSRTLPSSSSSSSLKPPSPLRGLSGSLRLPVTATTSAKSPSLFQTSTPKKCRKPGKRRQSYPKRSSPVKPDSDSAKQRPSSDIVATSSQSATPTCEDADLEALTSASMSDVMRMLSASFPSISRQHPGS